MSVFSLNGKGINESNELDCLRELVIQGGDDSSPSTVTIAAGTANIGDVDVASMPKSATATTSNVSDSASSVTLLALNANRLGATIYNDSSAVLYVKFGTTASATSFTVALAGNASGIGGAYEVPFGYTGRIDGIWASDAGGSARVTELT